ncbi:hypothetical protein KY338_04410 [Candidatus Woesearchaeota archaeon]|nr:hypothetical protein [Candidatus Woesearchaeota archaeon]MBW3005776.1 hypothetical protein [Candidatus Woesearchaeota archaeon]
MKLLCFGNEFIEEDSLAKELADELKIEGVEFIKCDSLNGIKGDVIVLDVVKGLEEVKLIPLDKVKDFHPVSMHDFDLGTELKLRKSIGEINNVTIIGIPMQGDKENIKQGIIKLINELRKK